MVFELFTCKLEWKTMLRLWDRREKLAKQIRKQHNIFKKSMKRLDGLDIVDFDTWRRNYGK